MADKRSVDEIITAFLLNTTRLRPSKHSLSAVACCAWLATKHGEDTADVDLIPQVTGSVAEFSIEPILPHVGDTDVMYYVSSQLAIPRGYSPPTQLPAEFHNYVRVFEIDGSDLFPGYVYLRYRYLLVECPDDDTYHTVDCEPRDEFHMPLYVSNCLLEADERDSFAFGLAAVFTKGRVHGPAVLTEATDTMLPVDAVRCVRCLMWPPQAADWPTRHRNFGWPDLTTIDRVVKNGCDVVGVAHRRCRQDELMGYFQWRLSFSRAEILLINSWMPIQQIVYHLLRVYVKNGPFADNSSDPGEGTLSNYHIKTLMLWTCELKPGNWWTDDLSFVRICVELLHTLAALLTGSQCRHYFVYDCNLFDTSFGVETIAMQLASVSEAEFSGWFVNDYMQKSSESCPESVSRLFNDVSTIVKLQHAVSEVVRLRVNTAQRDLYSTFRVSQYQISGTISKYSLTVRSCACLMTELAKINSRFSEYFTAVAFLHVAYRMSRNGFSDELMDVLGTMFQQLSDTHRYCNPYSSVLTISKVAKLMKFVANKSPSTVQLIEIELCKAYLHRALRCKDNDSDSIYCLSNVYLAVLYYSTGHYQTAMDHCTVVTRSQDHSQCNSNAVQGELLPKIDDNIDNLLGLSVFYQYLRTGALSQQRRQYVSVFASELLAHYLHIRCLQVISCRQFRQTLLADEVQRYGKYISDEENMFVADALLFKSVSLLSQPQRSFRCKHFLHKPPQEAMNPARPNTSELVELLQQSAVEHLTVFRQFEALDFASVCNIVTSDFEALYACKRGDYQRCLQLCTVNLRTLLSATNLSSVFTFSESLQLFDDDIVSLTALTLIVDPECRDHSSAASVTQLTLSLYLMTQCQLKLCRSVTPFFQTLTYVRSARRKLPVQCTLDQLTLKLTARKIATRVIAMLLESD